MVARRKRCRKRPLANMSHNNGIRLKEMRMLKIPEYPPPNFEPASIKTRQTRYPWTRPAQTFENMRKQTDPNHNIRSQKSYLDLQIGYGNNCSDIIITYESHITTDSLTQQHASCCNSSHGKTFFIRHSDNRKL